MVNTKCEVYLDLAAFDNAGSPIASKPDNEAAILELERMQELTAELGLVAQTTRARMLLEPRKWPVEFPKLSPAQLNVWRAWLPATYYKRNLSEYRFDIIPVHVLELWKQCKKLEIFDCFEIWTPEKHAPDPVLVGTLGEDYYLLARWSESDENLISFEEIKQRLKKVWFGSLEEWLGYGAATALISCVVSLVIGAATVSVMALIGTPLINFSYNWVVLISVLLSPVAGFEVLRWFRNKSYDE